MQESVLNGRSSVLGAMCWMIGISFLLNVALCWLPVVGHVAAALIGGYIGGRRAGTAGRALLAAVLPCILSFFLCSGLGLGYGAVAREPGAGALIGGLIGMASGVAMIAHNIVLIIAALVGGVQRQSEPY